MFKKNKTLSIALASVFTPVVLLFFLIIVLYLYRREEQTSEAEAIIKILPYTLCTIFFYILSFRSIRNTNFGAWLSFALIEITTYMLLDTVNITGIVISHPNTFIFFKRFFILNSLLCILIASAHNSNKFLASFRQHKKRILIFFLAVFAYLSLFSYGEFSKYIFCASIFVIDLLIIIMGAVQLIYLEKIKGNPYSTLKYFSFAFFAITLSLLYIINSVEYLYVASGLSIISLNILLYSTDKS